MNSAWKKFLTKWLGFSLFFHLLTAVFSRGYYDADEQFQVLEFLGARLGRSSYHELAWEYQKQIRSWVQPFLYEAPTRLWMSLGIQDPFHWAMGARLMTALIGWLSLVALARCTEIWFTDLKWRQWAVRLTCLFWFVPYFHARTSAESLGGSFFLLAITLDTLGHESKRLRGPIVTGIFLGLSFFCRFQMGLAITAFMAWIFLVDRKRASPITPLAVAFAGTLGAGLAIDAWGYGQWVWTPWNYFDQNLIQGVAASMGRSPWSDYLRLVTEQIPPLGAWIVLATLLGICARPLNVLSFTTLAFGAGHSALAHKELRFIFPIAGQIPVITTFALARWTPRNLPRVVRRSLRFAVACLLLINVAVLVVVALKPATAQMGFYQTVYRHEPAIRELFHAELDPYSPFKVPLNFYRPPGLVEHEYHSPTELRQNLRADRDLWLFYENFELTGNNAQLAASCHLEYTTYPAWLNYLSFLAGPRRFANRWSLYRCRLGPETGN